MNENINETIRELLRIIQIEVEKLKINQENHRRDLEQLKRAYSQYVDKDTMGQSSLEERVRGINSQVGSLNKSQEVIESRLIKVQESLDVVLQWKTRREAQILIFASLPAILGGLIYVIKILVDNG